jgi:serine/threonine protein kinase
MALQTGSVIHGGRYKIEKLLARGGFGFVYLAHDQLTRRQVVLKELNPALIGDVQILRRFVREGRTMIRLSHPNIVHAQGMFKSGGHHYLVIEYLPGGALSNHTDRGRRFSLSRAVEITFALCDALSHLHSVGIVHCDLNPSNILFDAQGQPKLIDLGIAHVPDDMVHRRWQTRGDFGLGTVLYMAPEQLSGVRDDPRIDQYALGVILYQMLSGRHYLDFDLQNTPSAYADNIARVHEQHPQPLTEVPAEVAAVIMRTLSKDPADRYPDLRAFRTAFTKALLLHEPSKAGLRRPFSSWGRRQERRPRGSGEWPRWVWRALVAVNVLAMLIIAWLLIGTA